MDEYDFQTLKKITVQFPQHQTIKFLIRIVRELRDKLEQKKAIGYVIEQNQRTITSQREELAKFKRYFIQDKKANTTFKLITKINNLQEKNRVLKNEVLKHKETISFLINKYHANESQVK